MNSFDVSLYIILKITTEGVVSFSILKCSSDIKINLTKKVPISDTFNEIILFNLHLQFSDVHYSDCILLWESAL